MKQTVLILLLFLPTLLSYGHHKHKKHKEENTALYPHVQIGNITTYYTTRDAILANPILTTDSVGCRVSGFTVSLQAPGHPFFGPLYSNTWEMTDIQKSKIKEWDYKDVTLYIQDIHLNCHEKDAVANPFSVKFDH
jgi:hypothetical protein